MVCRVRPTIGGRIFRERPTPTRSTLINNDNIEELWVKETSLIRARTGARTAMQKNEGYSVGIAKAFEIDAVAIIRVQ